MTDDLELDYDDLAAQLSERTRVVAFPVAANSVGTAPDVAPDRRRSPTRRARSRGPTQCTTRRTGRSTSPAWGVDVLVCSPYKFFGPHLGLAFGKRELLESWRPYKVRPAANDPVGRRFELGTPSTSCSRASSRPWTTSARWAGTRSSATSARSASASWTGSRTRSSSTACATMEGRVPTFCFNVPRRAPEEVATLLAERDLAVWHGDYYAVETMRHLGLEDGAVRAGIVHYNTEEEVDRLLDALADLA